MNGKSVFVKPAEGLKVRDPVTMDHLPATGAEVPRTTYWLRRLRDGDVVQAKRAARKPAKAKADTRPATDSGKASEKPGKPEK